MKSSRLSLADSNRINIRTTEGNNSTPKTVILVAGARPNFVKLAPLYSALASRSNKFNTLIMHTGQHYDSKMSDIFFTELGIPNPHIHLGVGSGSHAEQTAKVMIECDKVFTEESPDMVVVFGDINSTLAASVTAAKRGIAVAHVEAGLRSFDRTMPEELNRLVTDCLADLLLTPSKDADRNLEREGVPRERIELVGNIMIDTLVKFLPSADKSNILETLDLQPQKYALLTMHRPGNVDDQAGLDSVLDIIEQIAQDYKVVFPAHPRTRKNLVACGGRAKRFMEGGLENLVMTEPLGYFDFLKLQKESGVTLTDSGGVQEETSFLGVPCLTLRPNTERPITITHGTNHLIGLNVASAVEHARRFMQEPRVAHQAPPLWDGHTAERIADSLERFLFGTGREREHRALTVAAREEALKALTV